MKPEKLNKQLEELFGKIPEHYSLLDQQIDIDLQMAYFEESAKVKKDSVPKDILENESMLYDEEQSLDFRKKRLIQIAGVEQPEAFRMLERFAAQSKGEIQNWGIMALQESKMLLESIYLQTPQVFISTGLGGKGQLLRYFSVFFQVKDNKISSIEEKVMKNELEVYLKREGGVLEYVETDHNTFKMMILLPLSIDITNFFYNLLDDCNEYGNFLYHKCIITNVKELERREIDAFLKKNRDNDKNYNLLNEDL